MLRINIIDEYNSHIFLVYAYPCHCKASSRERRKGGSSLPEPQFAHHWENGIYAIRTDPAAIDFEAAYAFLSAAPWASGLPPEAMDRALRNSLRLSLLERDRQIGLTRVITDFATYAYLCDVYIFQSRRHRGPGSWLIRFVLEHPDIACLKRIALITHDAQNFYRHLGFQFVSPDHRMERLSQPAIPPSPYATGIAIYRDS